MKVGCKRLSQLSPADRKRLVDELDKWQKSYAEQQRKVMSYEITNNLFKIFVCAINDELGIGKYRIGKLLTKLNKDLANIEDTETFWLLKEEECKKILTKEIYEKFFRDNPFKLERNVGNE